ncbi:MAG: hypothetical protein LBD78_00700 [Spirochaetaceae bacterium]|nr:hypothetical protein [Spirochaetaceae bacterium]
MQDNLPSTEMPITIKPFVESTVPFAGQNVQRVDFADSETAAAITLEGLDGQSVFLVKVNRSNSVVNLYDTGHAYPERDESGRAFFPSGGPQAASAAFPYPPDDTEPSISGIFTTGDGIITRYDHPGVQEFNNNHPPPGGTVPGRAFRAVSPARQSVLEDSRQFWVESSNDNFNITQTSQWKQITAVLRAQGTHSNIWISEDNFSAQNNNQNIQDNKVTIRQAAMLAKKFDAIYDYTTPIFGFEYGGGVPETDETFGGIDGETRIQILIYDIDFDQSPGQNSGTFGYFWAKDHYTNSRYYSNKAEIFYIDSFFMDSFPDAIYSTLAHEFQHMIQFNEKELKRELPSAATWYNEMLSLLAEDMIAPLIGVSSSNDQHPSKNRIPMFLGYYNYAGITEWRSGNYSMISYANVYAFGAYMVRNYGGADLVREIAGNDSIDMLSINQALGKINGGMTEGQEFTEALSRYGEALVYSGINQPKGVHTFDQEDSKIINDINYIFSGFDIWKMNFSNTELDSFVFPIYNGPLVWDLRWTFEMRGHSIILQSLKEWQNVKGDLVIEAQKPKSDYIDLYILIR